MKRNKSHGVSIESEFYIRGNNVIMNGSSRETYTYIAEGNYDGISNTGNDTIVWEQKNEVYAEEMYALYIMQKKILQRKIQNTKMMRIDIMKYAKQIEKSGDKVHVHLELIYI